MFGQLSVILLLIGVSGCSTNEAIKRYLPTWDSLDKRPLPSWYDQAKVGIFLHWGVFSVPSFTSEWFWYYWKGNPLADLSVLDYMRRFYAPNFAYPDFAQNFKAEFFDPAQWADLFERAGAKYVVLTAKHHEGYCNWPFSKSWQWNSMDVGPGRDLVGDLANAVKKKTGIRFGLYHSLFEWFNPEYLKDKAAKFSSQNFVTSKTMPELYDLVTKYKPEVIWSDGDAGPHEYWNSTGFLAWLYNDSPVKDSVVVNDRWGDGCSCKHGDFYNCVDRYRPGKLIIHKWENCMTLDKHAWGYRREASINDISTIKELIEELSMTIAYGGNILINVGPTAWGTIAPIYEERLIQLGQWLGVNGEAIYSTRPWRVQKEEHNNYTIWYTHKPNNTSLIPFESTMHLTRDRCERNFWQVYRLTPSRVYAIVIAKNPIQSVNLSSVQASPTKSVVTLLGYGKLPFKMTTCGTAGIEVQLPNLGLNYPDHFNWGLAFAMDYFA